MAKNDRPAAEAPSEAPQESVGSEAPVESGFQTVPQAHNVNPATGAIEAPVSAKQNNRTVYLNYGGQVWARKALILDLWAKKMPRGQIAKICGCPYQIVFAATKGVPGGPDDAAKGSLEVATPVSAPAAPAAAEVAQPATAPTA